MVARSKMIIGLSITTVILAIALIMTAWFSVKQYGYRQVITKVQTARETQIKNKYLAEMNAKDAEIIRLREEKRQIVYAIVTNAKKASKLKPITKLTDIDKSMVTKGFHPKRCDND